MRIDKLLYFELEPVMDKHVLASDCGSNMSAGAERDELWNRNRCACHCLNIAIQAALKEGVVQECLAPLTVLGTQSQSTWNKFKKTQMEILHREEERSEDEGEADCDGDEDFEIGGEWQPHLK